MLLFKISEFEYFTNFLKGSFLCFIHSFRFFNLSIIDKSKISFFIWALGYTLWMTVFIPSPVYSLSVFDIKEWFKTGQSLHMFENQSSEEFIYFIGCSGAFYSDIVSQIQDCAQKGVSKSSGGFIKFNNTVKFERASITNQSTEKYANNSKTASNNCHFVGTRSQFWLSLFIGGLLGAGIGVAIVKFIFWFLHNKLFYCSVYLNSIENLFTSLRSNQLIVVFQ